MVVSFKPRRDKRGRAVCDCGAYHFPHRKGSGACESSLYRDQHLALRAGLTELEALAMLSAAALERKYPIPHHSAKTD